MVVVAQVLLAGLIGLAPEPPAAELEPGAHLQAFTLADQFDAQHTVDGQARLLLFSRDRDVAGMAAAVLDRRAAGFLAAHHASLLLDVSRMPRLVAWAVARPRLRRHAFPLLLDAGPGPTRALPAQEKRLTLVYLKDLVVERVRYVSDADGLEQALDALDR